MQTLTLEEVLSVLERYRTKKLVALRKNTVNRTDSELRTDVAQYEATFAIEMALKEAFPD